MSAKLARGNRRLGGEAGIAGLVALANVCTANNTVAIIISSRLAREIAEKSEVSARRSASLLDIFSCIVQGIVPYAAQVLLAGSIAGISPLKVSINNWYCLILLVVSVVAVVLGKPTGVRKKALS